MAEGRDALKALAALVRSRTDDGKLLVEVMLRIVKGGKFKTTVVTIDGRVKEVRKRPSLRDRMEAAAWLADRGWGKKDVIGAEGEQRRTEDETHAPARFERVNSPAVGICNLCQDTSPGLPTAEQVERWLVAHAAQKHPEHLQEFRLEVLRGPKIIRLGGS